MYRIYSLIIVLIFTGCNLQDSENFNVDKRSKNSISNSATGLLKDYKDGKLDSLIYATSLRDKAMCLANYVRSSPITCADSKSVNGASNCLVWSESLTNVAKDLSKEAAKLDDTFYRSKSPNEGAQKRGYYGAYVLENVTSLRDENDLNIKLIKAFDKILKDTNGMCSKFMDKRVQDFGIAYTIKEVDGNKKIYWAQVLGDDR